MEQQREMTEQEEEEEKAQRKTRKEIFLASLALNQNNNGPEKIVLRDAKAKLITFEMISIHRFAIT